MLTSFILPVRPLARVFVGHHHILTTALAPALLRPNLHPRPSTPCVGGCIHIASPGLHPSYLLSPTFLQITKSIAHRCPHARPQPQPSADTRASYPASIPARLPLHVYHHYHYHYHHHPPRARAHQPRCAVHPRSCALSCLHNRLSHPRATSIPISLSDFSPLFSLPPARCSLSTALPYATSYKCYCL